MASDGDVAEVREIIESFYRFAIVPLVWEVEVNERVAEVFHRDRLSFTCARGVIYKWGRHLEMASKGLAVARMPAWA